MRSTTASQLRLCLTLFMLLCGGILPQNCHALNGIARVTAQQQELPDAQDFTQAGGKARRAKEQQARRAQDKEDQKINDKEDDKNDDEDVEDDEEDEDVVDTLPPTPRPTVQPTPRPTPSPTRSPTIAPTERPLLEEAFLPEIMINLKTASGMTMGACDSFFHDFVENLLTSSRVISPSSLNATSLDVSLESLGDEEEDAVTTEFSKAAEDGDSAPASNNIRILIDGIVYYYPITNPAQDYNSSSLKESMSHSMTVYLTLWGPGDLEHELEKCGISDPKVTSVHVDGNAVTMPEHDDDESPAGATAQVANAEAAMRTSMHAMMSTFFLGGVTIMFLLL